MSGFTTVSASHLQDATGTPITNATISFLPVGNNGVPLSFKAGGTAGQVVSQAVTALVTAGAFTINLADSSLTSPLNVGYRVSVFDNVSGKSLLGNGYGCFQPTGTTYNFDNYVPNLSAQVTVQYGPTGATGATGATGTAGANGAPGLAGVKGDPGANAVVIGQAKSADVAGACEIAPNGLQFSLPSLYLTPVPSESDSLGGNIVIGYNSATNLGPAQPPADHSTFGGDANVVIGYNAANGGALTGGRCNIRESVIVGKDAAASVTGSGIGVEDFIGVVIGSLALADCVGDSAHSSTDVVYIGQKAGIALTSTYQDVMIGTHVGTSLVSSTASVLVGDRICEQAGGSAVGTTISECTYVGSQVNSNNTAGFSHQRNTSVGVLSAVGLTTGSYNTFSGYNAGNCIQTGTNNSFYGTYCGAVSAGYYGTASGSFNAFYGDTQDGSPWLLSTGSYNVGILAGGDITTGSHNVLVGAGSSVGSTNNQSTALGSSAYATGHASIAIGASSASGSYSIVLGAYVDGGQGGTSAHGDFSVVIGGASAAPGVNTVVLGASAGRSQDSTSTNNTLLGYGADAATGVSNAVQLGAGTNPVSNTLQFQSHRVIGPNGELYNGSTGGVPNVEFSKRHIAVTLDSANAFTLIPTPGLYANRYNVQYTPTSASAAANLTSMYVDTDTNHGNVKIIHPSGLSGATLDLIVCSVG